MFYHLTLDTDSLNTNYKKISYKTNSQTLDTES